jgi:hypothetical protein
MMAELIKYVASLKKELIKKGIKQEKLKDIESKLENKHNLNKIRDNPNMKGQDLVYFYDDLRKEYFELLKIIGFD